MGGRGRFPLPLLLLTFHLLVMVAAGVGWILASHQYGVPLVGPEANFWYMVVKIESFPVSLLAERAVEASLTWLAWEADQVARWIQEVSGLSLSGMIASTYWASMVVFGSLQWYLIGVLALKVHSRVHHQQPRES